MSYKNSWWDGSLTEVLLHKVPLYYFGQPTRSSCSPMVRDQHFWKSQAQFLPETLKSFRLLLHPLQKNDYYMYCKCLLNCFIAMIKRDFMTHWYEVLDTLKSVNGKAKLRLMKMLKFKVTITQKLQIIPLKQRVHL